MVLLHEREVRHEAASGLSRLVILLVSTLRHGSVETLVNRITRHRTFLRTLLPNQVPQDDFHLGSSSCGTFFLTSSSTNNNGMSVRKYNCWSRHRDADVEFCLPTINSISTMNRHDVVGVRKEKVILIALNCEVGN